MAQEVALIVMKLYNMNPNFYDVFDSVKCAIKKYDTDIDKISLKIAGDLDYKKIIWQILFDLRFAKDTDYDFNIEGYERDNIALQDITSFLEKHTTEFSRKDSMLVDISRIDREEYLELIKKYDLK